MSAYLKLEKYFHRIHQLDHASAILGWDEAVMMPASSGDVRAEAQAELKVIRHETLLNPEIQELTLELENQQSSLSVWQQANLREIKRALLNARAIKKELVESLSLANSRCEQGWRQLRKENNWKDFLPLLDQVVKLNREEAAQRGSVLNLSPYDSLLDQFSPGVSCQEITLVFNQLKTFLPSLIEKIMEHQKAQNIISAPTDIPIEQQKKLGLEVMKILGFNFNRGRLDVSHHPFCGGVPQDVRITTRYSTSSFLESLTGVIHETGHALYEQNLPAEWKSQPVGCARGMDIHESQSLLFENYIGANIHFLKFLTPIIKNQLSSSHSSFWEPQNLFNYYTRVKPSLIRVSADEVTYPMHIILRFEIERDLIEKKIEVKDIPEIWDDQMQKYLGLSTKNNFKDGCMQDVHWPSGAFGYFPSYSLGALFAAQLFTKMKKTFPTLEQNLELGDLSSLKNWLREHIWSMGSLCTSPELIVKATGEKLNPIYFKNYIEEKYLM